jgi:hypothetical protein
MHKKEFYQTCCKDLLKRILHKFTFHFSKLYFIFHGFLKFGQISRILKELMISKLKRMSTNGLYPARNHSAPGPASCRASQAKRLRRPARDGPPSPQPMWPAPAQSDAAVQLPPVSRWPRCSEVFTSSTCGEGVTRRAWTGESGLTEARC